MGMGFKVGIKGNANFLMGIITIDFQTKMGSLFCKMKNLELDKKNLYNYWFFQNLIDDMYSLECRAEGGVDLGEMPKYTKYCTYIVYRLWYGGYGVTNLIIFSKSNLPFYLMKQILS